MAKRIAIRIGAAASLLALAMATLLPARYVHAITQAVIGRIQNAGTDMPVRYRLNMAGSGVSCADDAANGRTTCTVAGGGTGTVTSVGMSLPNIFTVTGSPVSTTGTLTATFASQAQGLFLASPSGSSGVMAARAIAAIDVPPIAESGVTNLTTDLAAKAPLASPTFTGTATTPALAVTNASSQMVIGTTNTDTLSFTAPASPRTITFADPGLNDSVCYLAATQTQSNKTFTAPVVNGLTSSGSTAIDFSGNSSIFKPSTGGVQGVANEDFGCNGNCSFGNAASNNTITVGKTTTVTVLAGSQRTHRTTVADAAYAMVLGDRIVAYTSISATRIVTLIPQANCSTTAPCDFWVSNESATAQTITIAAQSGNVNGAASVTCTSTANGGGCFGYCNGTNCFMTFSR